MLRLREGRQCRDVPDGAREHHLSRGAEDGGQTLRHRGPGEGAFGGGDPPQRRPRIHVRPERLGRGVFRQLPAPRDRGAECRTGLFPAGARTDRRHDPQVRPRVLPGEGRPHVEGCAGGGLQEGVPALDGPFAGARARRVALRPFPRPGDFSRAQHLGPRRGLRRPHAPHRQDGCQVPEFARERNIQQETRAVRTVLRQAGHPAAGFCDHGGGRHPERRSRRSRSGCWDASRRTSR